LRELRESDLDTLTDWWNEPSVMIHQTSLVLPQPAAQLRRTFASWSRNDPGSRDAGFSIEHVDGTLLGHATLFGGNTPARTAEFAIMLGPAYHGQGYGREATDLMLRHGFNDLGLHRISLGVYAYNQRALRAYAAVGFVPEGCQRQAVYHQGKFHDRILMAILAAEYRSGNS